MELLWLQRAFVLARAAWPDKERARMAKRRKSARRVGDGGKSELRQFLEPDAPFNETQLAHVTIHALSGLGAAPKDRGKFLRQLQHVEWGLSAEDQFMTLLAWLGQCRFAHKLDQDSYSSQPCLPIRVPDLFVVFEHGRERFTALVEVKSTEEFCLPWRSDYRDSLLRYAELLHLPLLLAWRPRRYGSWILVDASSPELGSCERIEFEKAAVHNLMGLLAGDFWIKPKAGVGIHFEGRILTRGKASKNGMPVKGQLTNAYIGFRDGTSLRNLTTAEMTLILATATEEYGSVEGDVMRWGHAAVVEGAPNQAPITSVQALLRMLLKWPAKDGERIAWRHVLKGMDQIESRAQMEEELSNSIGRVVHIIAHVRPKTWPAFIPQSWAADGAGS